MKRLTKYKPSDKSMFPYKLKDEELSTELDSVHKLGQLEDIEEELGIDLITLFKALKQGYIIDSFYNNDEAVTLGGGLLINYKDKCFVDVCLPQYGKYNRTYYFKDYGKTWSLTREEL